MSGKDYTLIAYVLRTNRPSPTDKLAYFVWERICRDMSDVLARENPRFNPSIFAKAVNA